MFFKTWGVAFTERPWAGSIYLEVIDFPCPYAGSSAAFRVCMQYLLICPVSCIFSAEEYI